MTSAADQEAILRGHEIPAIFRLWEEKYSQPGYDPVPVLKRLSEIFEAETEIYMRKDRDPFDERHPSRTDPDCEFGRSLKLLFRKDHFMNRLVNDYLRDNFFSRQNIQKSSLELNIAACRLILVIMPGLDTSAVFQVEYDSLINRLFNWAMDSVEPLQSYATGLLAAAMEVQDVAVTFRDLNFRLVPKMLKRLKMLQRIYKNKLNIDPSEILSHPMDGVVSFENTPENTESSPAGTVNEKNIPTSERPFAHLGGGSVPNSPEQANGNNLNGLSKFGNTTNLSTLLENDASQNTSDVAKYTRNFYIPIYPPTTATSQMLILRYLTSMGEYQEFLGQVFENNAMSLIFGYIENLDAKDTCLAFEALKYLASLLCHKKFALEFIARGGLERLLKVPHPSVAATGVSITLYYLAYCEDAMERICAMPPEIITELIKYALWLLGCSHDSGRCHATMFFGLCFQFKVILDEFDKQDGLRQLYNVISVLPILADYEDPPVLNDDEECAAKQLVRHVCVSLKKYMESHLYFKYTHFMRQQCPNLAAEQPTFRASKCTLEQISEQVRTLQENLPPKAHWTPVEQLLHLRGVTLLLRIIAYSYEWNNSGRAETVRSALDVLSICCVIPRVFTVFCELLEFADNSSSAGINTILGAAIGEIVTDAEVQKAALAVLVHCICAPTARPMSTARFGATSSAKKKIANRFTEELVERVWECVCSNNGIIVLLQLMQVKTPITDADCIRGMACRALAGLARSERVRQIIGKLPLFANGQLQHLMRDPILQEKRAEHVIFQKYALELLERVSGKTKTMNQQLDVSLANIHKANVVAQTRIQYNEQQLTQLIYEHLLSRGLTGSAAALQKEASLNINQIQPKPVIHHSPFSYKGGVTNSVSRTRLRTRTQELNNIIHLTMSTSDTQTAVNGLSESQSPTTEDPPSATVTPIKLIKKSASTQQFNTTSSIQSNSSQRSLQKQISSATETVINDAPPTQRCNSLTITEPPPSSQSNVTLTTIVTEYLTNQHALCNNPMSTCPQFDLFVPHKCPDPKPNKILDLQLNLTARMFKAQAGYNTTRLDRRFVHTQFCPTRTIRPQDYNEIQFTCCDLLPCNNLVLAGTYHGEAKVYNISEGTEEFSSQCHDSFMDSVKCNREGTLALTSCFWRPPLSVLWSIDKKEFVSKLQFAEDFYCEFSNVTQDKILGTKQEAATIYDLHTGQKISTFVPKISNQYTKNKATFCPTDELILSDGVLWDVRAGKEIHKFDKLNQTLSGVFHPNGLEIVSNTEVWDLRTFHLLQTVPVLDQCLIKFSPMNVIYGISLDLDTRVDFDATNSYDSSFKVLDAYDYSSISTIDVKRNIYDISINKYGSHIALVENQGAYESSQETFIRIYAVGMRKNDEQEEEDMDVAETDENSASDSDSSHIFRIDNGGDRRRNRRRRNNRRNRNDENGSENDEWETVGTSSSSDNDDGDNEDGENEDGDSDAQSGSDDENNDNDSWSSESDIMDVEFELL